MDKIDRHRRRGCGLLTALAAITTLAIAQPSSDWGQEGRTDLLKGLMLEAFKKSLGPGGEIISSASDLVIEPLVAAATARESSPTAASAERIEAWLLAMSQAGVSAMWGPYGFLLAGGKLTIGGAVYSVESLVAAAQDEQNTAILFGKGTGGWFDRFNNVMADTPFIELAVLRNQGINAGNLGERIKSEEELRRYWGIYLAQIKDIYGKANAEEVGNNWPKLQNIWRLKRAEVVLPEFAAKLEVAVQQAIRKAGQQDSRDASTTGSPQPAASPNAGPAPPPGAADMELVRGTPLVPPAAPPNWPTVSDGHMSYVAYEGDYKIIGEYSWSVPGNIGPQGTPITLTVSCTTGKNNRLATGIGMSADNLDIYVDGKRVERVELPANCDVGDGDGGSLTAQVMPRGSYGEGSKAEIRIGPFWASAVKYPYTARRIR